MSELDDFREKQNRSSNPVVCQFDLGVSPRS
jgi:hypothetical protein